MTRLIIVIAAIAIIGYGLFEARKLIEGPTVVIESPTNGSATSSTAVIISGEAENISFLTINDAPAYTDEQGHFSELLSLSPGFTVLTVAAIDRFGRRISKSVSINVLNYCTINNA
jgi:hypothetical protein